MDSIKGTSSAYLVWLGLAFREHSADFYNSES